LHVAIDDFGTGYSSLRHLAKLPVDTLKIDRSFIQRISIDPDDLTIVSTVISLAHSFRMTCVAEGVETIEQINVLRLLKCDAAQGYLYSRPIPAEEFLAFVLRMHSDVK
jgi:EAL domain-containing protein (putative c-di-GMP-specific phosphodiesterase class I)